MSEPAAAAPLDITAGIQRVLELGADFAVDAVEQVLTDRGAPTWVLDLIKSVRSDIIDNAKAIIFEVPAAPERIDERTEGHGAITIDERTTP